MASFLANQFKKPTGFTGKIIANLMIKGNGREYQKLIPAMKIQPQDRLLEIGYGHGWGIFQIASSFDCHISGIDFSELMFNMATRRNRKFIHRGKVELFHGDFNDFQSPKSNFNNIFCLNVVYFWDDLDKPFNKIIDLLVSGGMFCFTMAHRDDLNRMKFIDDSVFNKYTIEQVTEALSKAGFTDIEYDFDFVYLVKCRKQV